MTIADSSPAPPDALGNAVVQFDAALRKLRAALESDSQLYDAVFSGSDDWTNLLSYKLVPHLAGEGCLIAAVTGGTNTGKSTVFNLLLGHSVSAVTATAAATARPVIAACASRAQQCLEGKLVPEFMARSLATPEAATTHDEPSNALFVSVNDELPERLALLDTPDVDSIEREHWAVADTIRAAGDVLIAVLTAEKYKDDRVVEYFRQAHASGRVIVPVMNKANPASDFAVARKQLDEFRALIGFEGPAYVIPHDFALSESLAVAIRPLTDGAPDLMSYLQSLDVPAIKQRVYRGTVGHFAASAGAFLQRADDVGGALRTAVGEFEARTAAAATNYDPAPGAAVGGLFHEYVQQKRSAFFRWIGSGSKLIAKGATAVGRTVTGALRRRASLEPTEAAPSDNELRLAHGKAIERIARELAADFFTLARNWREPASHLVVERLNGLDVERAVKATQEQTLHDENISDEFRRHAAHMLDTWWNDNKGKRRVLEALDGMLAITPAAIALPISMHTGGVGVAETLVVAGPVVEQFVARVIEYQFGDAMFDFLSPWRRDQQKALERAMMDQLANPVLQTLRAYLNVFDGAIMTDLKRWQKQCQIV